MPAPLFVKEILLLIIFNKSPGVLVMYPLVVTKFCVTTGFEAIAIEVHDKFVMQALTVLIDVGW